MAEILFLSIALAVVVVLLIIVWNALNAYLILSPAKTVVKVRNINERSVADLHRVLRITRTREIILSWRNGSKRVSLFAPSLATRMDLYAKLADKETEAVIELRRRGVH